jgi:hypothetical protein
MMEDIYHLGWELQEDKLQEDNEGVQYQEVTK